MIHGLSKHTQGAGGAVDYFLDDQYLDANPTPEDPRAGEWREREPKPLVLEGDPRQIVALCDSLSFKNRYTSGVLSFSPEESAKIAATPGLKEQLIQELREFAYAGVKSDDCKPMLVVQHEHTGRLELHYLIPRVSLESGKYFNPFPPNYDGRKGKGTNDVYKEQNDTFTDYVCSKYDLQNQRDPLIAREIKISKFDPNKVDKKSIHEAVRKLIDGGGIKSREDIVSFLEKAGGTITRKGDDYLSVKFDNNKKAIRLKGEFYGEQSYTEIRARIESTAERINRPLAEIEHSYAEVLSDRAGKVEKRHDLKGLATERAEDFNRKSTSELKDYAEELLATKDSLVDYDESRRSVNNYITDNSALLNLADSSSSVDGIGGGVDDATSGAGPMHSGDPVIDKFNRELHKMHTKLANEDLQRTKNRWQLDPQQEKQLREIRDWITKLFAGLSLGRNFFTGRAEPMAPRDIALARSMITQQQRELDRELRAVGVVVKQRERVEPLRNILDRPAEPAFSSRDDIEATVETEGMRGLETSAQDIDILLGFKRDKDELNPDEEGPAYG